MALGNAAATAARAKEIHHTTGSFTPPQKISPPGNFILPPVKAFLRFREDLLSSIPLFRHGFLILA